MHRAGSSEGGNGNDIRITPFFRYVGFGRRRHGLIDQVMDAECRPHRRRAKWLGDFFLKGSFRSCLVQRHGAAQKIIGIQITQHQIGIGHGGVFTAATVAGWTRICSGTFGADLQ